MLKRLVTALALALVAVFGTATASYADPPPYDYDIATLYLSTAFTPGITVSVG
ncbi:hypothetical protein AB0I84_36990 [Streptomyces spectabilis]|uniref:hypothetical protein n=1 Tax=Streptomyces spectabilis TaxID=68270 RepID=UPI0033FECB69